MDAFEHGSCRTVSSVDDIPPQSDVARLMILKGIVKLNGLTVASDVLRAIATDLEVTGEPLNSRKP